MFQSNQVPLVRIQGRSRGRTRGFPGKQKPGKATPNSRLLPKEKRMCFYNSDRNLQTSVNSHETGPLPEKQNSHFLSFFSDAHSQFLSPPRVRFRGCGLVRGSYQRMSFDTEISARERTAQIHNEPTCFSNSLSKPTALSEEKGWVPQSFFFRTRAACIPS